MSQNTVQLHDYQIVAKNFLLQHPKAGLFLDVGFGKTLTTLATLAELGQAGQIAGHILVIAPKAIARSTWIDEMAKWGIQANYVSLIVNEKGKQLTKKKREELYEQIPTHPAAFYFINREMITNLIDWHLNPNNKNQFIKPWPFQTIIIDELQSFKSYNSGRFKALKKVCPFVTRFIGLTGTPTPNGLMDLWSEIYLMDGGQRLGHNITAYRNTYFNPGLVVNDNVVSWWPKTGAEEAIYDRVKDVVISIQNPNLKLPQVTYNDVYCYMSNDEMDMYKQLMKDNVLDLNNSSGDDIVIEAANAAVLSAKLSQMASGTLYLDDTLNYTVIHQRKLEQLEYIINNTGSPVLVAYHFKSDKIEILKYLTNLGIDARPFDGSPEMIHEWNTGNIPVMILQPAAAGHGINIQDGGHTLVWYTLPWSLEEYIQTCGRLNRQGQKYPVMIHHLMTHGTIDQRILKCINEKDMSERALLEAVSATMNTTALES